MPLPLVSALRVDPLLTDIAISYANEPSDFAGDKAATITRVTERGGEYPIWDKSDFLRNEMAKVTNHEPAPKAEFRGTLGNYHCDLYALKSFLADADRKELNGLLDDQQKVRFLHEKAKIARDMAYAAVAFKTGVWTSNTEQSGVSGSPGSNEFKQFNDEASEPLRIIQDQMEVVKLKTGRKINKMVTNGKVIKALRRHPDILSLYQYTSGGLVTLDQLKQVFDLQEIVVADAVYESATEGSTSSMARIFGNHILLGHIADTWNKDVPTAVAGFSWSEYDKATATSITIQKWRENDPAGDWFKAEMSVTYKIVANDLAVFLKDAVA